MTTNDELFIKNDDTQTYRAVRDLTASEIINKARDLISERFVKGQCLESPAETAQYLELALASSDQEIFACLFLDNRHHIIAFEKLFFGTVDGAAVYPREIAKKALRHNAAAVILAHNHPSGVTEPSQADRSITKRIVNALKLLDIRVLDHVIVGAEPATSFARRGWI